MKLAVLGTDDDMLRLGAAARESGHTIAWLGDVQPADVVPIAQVAPGLVDRSSEWELLLDHQVADAVLVGRGAATTELRAEQLRRLAAEAVPLLVVHPIFDSVLPYYELDMTRRETGCVLRHYNPLAGHPILAELAECVRDGHPTIGPIYQVTCERSLLDSSRISALRHLAGDVEILAATAGDIRRVTAIGPRAADKSFASLQIQMSTSGSTSLRWSVRPSGGTADDFEMTLIGERGTVTLKVTNDSPPNRAAAWSLETIASGEREFRPLERFDAPQIALRQLAEAVATVDAEWRQSMSTWESATRAMEVVDAAELSLEKGRTIEVYQQQLTERLAFRGTMAAFGCGLLLLAFAAVVGVTILGGAEGAIGRRLVPFWPLALLAVLSFFLVLQAVPLLVRKRKKSQPE